MQRNAGTGRTPRSWPRAQRVAVQTEQRPAQGKVGAAIPGSMPAARHLSSSVAVEADSRDLQPRLASASTSGSAPQRGRFLDKRSSVRVPPRSQLHDRRALELAFGCNGNARRSPSRLHQAAHVGFPDDLSASSNLGRSHGSANPEKRKRLRVGSSRRKRLASFAARAPESVCGQAIPPTNGTSRRVSLRRRDLRLSFSRASF